VEAVPLDLVAELALVADRQRRVPVGGVDADAYQRPAVAQRFVRQGEIRRAGDEAERALGFLVDRVGAIAGIKARREDAAAAQIPARAELDAGVSPQALRGRFVRLQIKRVA